MSSSATALSSTSLTALEVGALGEVLAEQARTDAPMFVIHEGTGRVKAEVTGLGWSFASSLTWAGGGA